LMHDRLNEQAYQLYIQNINYWWDDPCPTTA
jgi:hypothetical protein